MESWTDTKNRQWDAAAIDAWLEEMDCGQYSEAFKGRVWQYEVEQDKS